MAGTILVAAGTNGAGKSSIVQPFIEAQGGSYFNPDTQARKLVSLGIPQNDANAFAWQQGHDQLTRSIESDQSFAFETTLGGHSIAYQLMRALAFKRRLIILYVGLSSVDLHIQRVQARVATGGHDIPEDKIRLRYRESRARLLSFIGTDATVRVWDNSVQSVTGQPSGATEVFRVEGRRLVFPVGRDMTATPQWAQPLLAQAIRLRL
ncbi:hypothetical protein [Sinimarinibacterium sp. CAU 1509]|uniref:hypothetical protein n=1 Tax=Sinimarinibacterium sp. CAU 1509 TaxID=2562283 RepID=UPI002697CE8C